MEGNHIIINTETLLEELGKFKEWSGPYLVKILAEIASYGDTPISLGSGGLIKYKNRYFVLTNSHVVSNSDISSLKTDINIPYTVDDKSFKMTILDAYKNSQDDIAVFEVRFNENILNSNHSFLDYENFIEPDISVFVDKTNVVFLHGYPYSSTTIDNDIKTIIAETLPYCTFVDNFDTTVNSLYLLTDPSGTDEYGNNVDLPHLGGFSGSFAYGYYYQEATPYKCLGVVTNWHRGDNLIEVYPMNEFIEFIELNFFNS